MTASAGPILALIADDDPADPILSVAFREASERGASVNALRYWPDKAERGLESRERWLFERLAFYQEHYPDLYTTAETVEDTSQVTARVRAARLTVVGQEWLSHHHRWHSQQGSRGSSALTVVVPHSASLPDG